MVRALRVHLALLAVQILFGLWPVAGAAVLRHMSPDALIGVRTLAGAPLLFLLARTLTPGGAFEVRRVPMLALLGALGVSANQLLFAQGLLRAGPVNGAMLGVCTPAFTVLMAALFGVERPTARRLAGVAVAFFGAAILLRVERLDLSDSTTAGNLLILTSSCCYSAYLVMARPLIKEQGSMAFIASVFVLGALEALPWTAPGLARVHWSALPAWAGGALAFVVLGPTLGAYALNAWALGQVDSSVVAVYVYLQPVISAVASWIVLGDRITPRAALSGCVIAAGVGLASFGPRIDATRDGRAATT